MENDKALYYNGSSARPVEVRVLLFKNAVHLYDVSTDQFMQAFPLPGTWYNKVGDNHFLYLDKKGTEYLQFANDHPLVSTLHKEVTEANMNWPQRLMKQRLFFLLAFLGLLLIGFYFLILSFVPWLGAKVIGIQQEIEIGDKLRAAMLAQARIVGEEQDTAGTRELQAFANELALSHSYPIRVTLLKSNTVNAYALPGGNVVVYTGLLRKIKTPEALAALLAHECTHVNERHSLRSMLRSAATGIVVSVLFSDATGISAALVGNAQTLNGLRYSRSLEEEADHKGMELLLKNEVALDGMRQLMLTLKEEGDLPGNLSFLSSHPLTGKRLKEAERYIKDHPQKAVQRKDLQVVFERLKHTW